MTAKKLNEARQRACYHSTAKRLFDEATGAWTNVWTCADCGYVLPVKEKEAA